MCECAALYACKVPHFTKCISHRQSNIHKLNCNQSVFYFSLQEIALWCCQTGYVDVNTPDNAGFTPLHETCIGGHVAIAKTLLAYGADINVASRLDGVRYVMSTNVFPPYYSCYV